MKPRTLREIEKKAMRPGTRHGKMGQNFLSRPDPKNT